MLGRASLTSKFLAFTIYETDRQFDKYFYLIISSVYCKRIVGAADTF